MKKQALTLAIAAALSAPSALAAQDTSGMRYTSAAEGFYASIRVRLESGASEDAKARFEDSSSRVGVRGSNDLGGGLEGFYQYEWEVDTNDTDRGQARDRTRVGVVGLRGAFGQIQMGTFWTQDYNWTHGSTDIANNASGWFNYDEDRPGRQNRAFEYTTPDLNGFHGALRLVMDGGGKGDENLDAWNVAGRYVVQGFTVAGAFNSRPNALKQDVADLVGPAQTALGDNAATLNADEDDKTSWTARLGYEQDNWRVNGWYGANNDSDGNDVEITSGGETRKMDAGFDDTTILSLAGSIDLDKVSVYALWEQEEQDVITGYSIPNTGTARARLDGATVSKESQKNTRTTLGVQYALGSNTKVWLEYAMRDNDGDKLKDGAPNPDREDDSFTVGMQHNF